MPEINEIEKKFLKIMGIEVHEWGLHDTEDKCSILNNPEKREHEGRTIRNYEYTEAYHGNKCNVSFITKGDYDQYGNTENEKKAVQVVRGELKYTLEHDERKNEWTVYITESWHTDYSRYAKCITAKMDLGYFCIKLEGSMDGDTEISCDTDNIYYKNRYDGTKSIVFSPSNFEEILSDSVSKIGIHVDDEEEDLNKAFAKFIPLFCGEILQGVLYQEVLKIKDDAAKKPAEKRKDIDELHFIMEKFEEYNEMKKGGLSEIELEFLSSMGIEVDGYDYDLDCDVLFDSDTCETFKFYGTRTVKDDTVYKRISTYMLNGTVVDLVEEVRDEYTEDYYYESKPNREIRVIPRDNYLEHILRLRDFNYEPEVALFINEHDPKEFNSYYTDHHYISYYINEHSSPEIEVSRSADEVSMNVMVHGMEGFKHSYIIFDEKRIRRRHEKGDMAFTAEDFQSCLIDEIEEISNPDIRKQYLYFLPLLSEVIPMVLTKCEIESLSKCNCNHEPSECQGCEDHIEDPIKLAKLNSILEQFNAYKALSASDKSKIMQKKLDEETQQN